MLIKHEDRIVNLNNVSYIKLNEKSLKIIFYFDDEHSCSFAFESPEAFSNFVSSLKAKEIV